MAKAVDNTFGPGLARIWRQARNRALQRLSRRALLTPTQLVELRHRDLYTDNLPVKTLIIKTKDKKSRRIKLSADLRRDLMLMNMMPFLICERPLTRPAFSSRTQGPPLSARQVSRIIKQPIKSD